MVSCFPCRMGGEEKEKDEEGRDGEMEEKKALDPTLTPESKHIEDILQV